MNQFQQVISRLGLNEQNGLYYLDKQNATEEIRFPGRVSRLLEEKIKPDALFCFDNKPLILFFDRPKDKKTLHRAIWNFNESPVAMIIEDDRVEIFNGYKLSSDPDCMGLLDRIGSAEKLDDFNYFRLVTGQTWEVYEKELAHRNRLDYKLLSEIRNARDEIKRHFLKPDSDPKKNIRITNALLGKSIFVRYLIDRKVRLYFDGRKMVWTNEDFCELLEDRGKTKRFFEYLSDSENGFNGDLFLITDEEYDMIPDEAFATIRRLLKGEGLKDGQLAIPFDFYDFSIIPVEFISNVYESFIGAENQASKGAYYTPLFLVDYILSQTVEPFLEKANEMSCKVLDPACGSGVFLVEVLRKLIEKYIDQNPHVPEQKQSFKAAIKKIVTNNIFGIDKDESALQVAVFSIYLTLLDYMDPPEIENFKFPNLMETNFFCADYFDLDALFNSVLGKVKFSFIIGNPPWMRGDKGGRARGETVLFLDYIEHRKKQERENGEPYIAIGNKQIAQAFLLRNSDFSSENTFCALIVTSKILYNLNSDKFRKYFLDKHHISQVFELAPVRKEIFNKLNDPSVAPACVIIYRHANGVKTDENMVQHIALKHSGFFSLFKVFTLSKHDIQYIRQGLLMQYDWLWKVLVYGSYLDFNFISRLKRTSHDRSIAQFIEKKDWIKGQGVSIGTKQIYRTSEIKGKPYIQTGEDVHLFWVNPAPVVTWKQPTVERIRRTELYKAPVLLVKGGNKNDFKSVPAIMYKDAVYTSSLTGIKGKSKEDIVLFRKIAGLLASDFSTYYISMTSSCSGIEREESHDAEKYSIPFLESMKIQDSVQEIESLMLRKNAPTGMINSAEEDIDGKIEVKLAEMNEEINRAYSLTEDEKDLIDYVNKVTIPVQMKSEGYEKISAPCKYQDQTITDYAEVFHNRFGEAFNGKDKQFTVEVWYSEKIIGLFFKIELNAKRKQTALRRTLWIDKRDDLSGMMQSIISLSASKITDQLFIQKDVRGFEAEDFYIFKPNEKRLWHKIIARLDVEEFADAMLRTGERDD
jgi:hypothetical protein